LELGGHLEPRVDHRYRDAAARPRVLHAERGAQHRRRHRLTRARIVERRIEHVADRVDQRAERAGDQAQRAVHGLHHPAQQPTEQVGVRPHDGVGGNAQDLARLREPFERLGRHDDVQRVAVAKVGQHQVALRRQQLPERVLVRSGRPNEHPACAAGLLVDINPQQPIQLLQMLGNLQTLGVRGIVENHQQRECSCQHSANPP
jgi:hypothetical protein